MHNPDKNTETWEEMLRSRVVPNKAIKPGKTLDGGTLEVKVPIQDRWWNQPPVTWIFPFRNERRIILDSLGADVYRRCQEELLVEELVDAFAEKHWLTFHEARLSVSSYLGTLVRNGLVVIKLPDKL